MQSGWNPNGNPPGGQPPGGQPPAQGFGQQPGAAAPMAGFGQQPGAPAPMAGFGQQPGAPAPMAGFGPQPGAPAQPGGFGQQPGAPAGGGFPPGGAPPPAGFGFGGGSGMPAMPTSFGAASELLRAGFLGSLLDFSFSNFVATKLLKVIYGLGILGSVGMMFMGIYAGFNRAFLDEYSDVSEGLLQIVLAPIGCLFGIIASRMMTELIVVQFRIMETLQEINHKTKSE